MPPRILVVEDEPSVADLIKAILTSEGYTVGIAHDGAEGLAMALSWSPDLVLLDVMLPLVDGGAVIKRLKSDARTAELPIIAMSAGFNIRLHSEELQGADGALAKPFDIDALLGQVAFTLARRRDIEPDVV